MEISDATFRLFGTLLHERTGQELSPGRSWRIETALKPLMKEQGFGSIDHLMAAVGGQRSGPLIDAIIDAMLNNETSFFRDAATFRMLIDEAFVSLAAARAASRRLRIWCAGCSTGQEVHSIAMMLAAAGDRWAGWTIDLVGTDVSAAAIARARGGSYSQFEIQRGLPVREMMRWFEPDGERWRARADLRERSRFEPHNLLDAPPAGRIADVILCRNVLLYFGTAKRQRVFATLASVIAPDGILMLGAGETVLGQTDRFLSDTRYRGVYRPKDHVGLPTAVLGRAAAG